LGVTAIVAIGCDSDDAYRAPSNDSGLLEASCGDRERWDANCGQGAGFECEKLDCGTRAGVCPLAESGSDDARAAACPLAEGGSDAHGAVCPVAEGGSDDARAAVCPVTEGGCDAQCSMTRQQCVVECNGKCVDPVTDRAYCGASGDCTGDSAGSVCAAGEVCNAGKCALSCQAGLVNCEGKCIDPMNDPRYCGADASCANGTTCAAGNVCSLGTCRLTCQVGLVNCGGKCIDPLQDKRFCGVDASCAGGVECGADWTCAQGTCRPLVCLDGQVLCGNRCIDPQSDVSYCGASGFCTGPLAGTACLPSQSCSAGTCVCPDNTVRCGDGCVDPLLDPKYCGATGTCTGANAGSACLANQVCSDGQCVPRPAIDWRPVYSVAPPRFKEGTSTIAHIIFDGANMSDTIGHTHWTKVGAPGVQQTGMWTPVQAYSGPFSSTSFWQADTDSKSFLDTNTKNDFLVCARYKPGRHPGEDGFNKIIFANGNPEKGDTDPVGTVHGGWALMQMHEAFCFHYHDAKTNGEWMVPIIARQVDRETAFSMEWTWHCGGRAGAKLNAVWESYTADMMAWGGQANDAVLGNYQATPASDLPSIGAYSDGSRPLFDGGVYEIIIKTEPATTRNMWRTIAEASGGMRIGNTAPVPIMGADRALHTAPPSTVLVQPGGYMLADQRVWMADVLPSDPAASGECYGVVASATDWSSLGNDAFPLAWSLGEARSEMRWPNPITTQCVNTYDPNTSSTAQACGTPLTPLDGSRYAFLGCFNPIDSHIHLYQNGTEFAHGTDTLDSTLYPRLDDPTSSFRTEVDGNSLGLQIHRVFACATADPTSCR
jgi:hypothetical protein